MKRIVSFSLSVICLVFAFLACVPTPEPQPPQPRITPSPVPTAALIPQGAHEVTFEFSVVQTRPQDTRELAVAFNTLQFLDYGSARVVRHRR
jgi:hypothetical protein